MNKFNLHSFLRIKIALKESALKLRTNSHLTDEVRDLKRALADLPDNEPSNLSLR